MKIAFDYQIFSAQIYGGISRYVLALATELTDNLSQDAKIFAPFYINNYLRDSRLNHGIHLPKFKHSAIYDVLNRPLALFLLHHYRPDIVHETYYSAKRLAPKSAKTVLTVYDMIHEKFAEEMSKLDPLVFSLKSRAVKRADHIICISENTRRDLIEILNVDENKTSTIHLGFTLTKQKLEISPFQNAKPFLLYVGERKSYKNFLGLLAAYSNSKNLQRDFNIVCFGGGVFSEAEMDFIRKSKIPVENIIHLTGDDEVLAHCYGSAHAFVYPSKYEGFGIPPLEAMSFGCPVICSSTSSIPEVVGNAGEYFDPYDTGSIRLAIENVVYNDINRNHLIAGGFERIKFFSWQSCAENTLTVYKSLL